MAVHPLRPAMDRRFGGPLPRQLPNPTRTHPMPPQLFTLYHAVLCAYAVLAPAFGCYPLHRAGCPRVTHPSAAKPHLLPPGRIPTMCSARLACVKHAASVHPEPGSNSHKSVAIQFKNQLGCSIPCFTVLRSM